MKLTFRLAATLLFALQLNTTNAFANGGICSELFAPPSAPAAKNIPRDLETYRKATPLLQGGMKTQIPIGNQRRAPFCWAYDLTELVDQQHLSNSGSYDPTAPDHNAFWNIGFQIASHPAFFAKLAKRISSGEISLEEASSKVFKLLSMRPHSKWSDEQGVVDEAFSIELGSNESIALTQLKTIGLVPKEKFDRPITTPEQEQALNAAVKDLVASVLKAPDRKALFANTDPNMVVNSALYNLMVEKITPVINANSPDKHPPYRPTDTFIYKEVEYTPLTFRDRVTQFNADNYVSVQMTLANQSLIYEVVIASLKLDIPVPMGVAIYNQVKSETDRIWSSDAVQAKPIILAGGHAILIVNMRMVDQLSVGQVLQNSWGPQGLDANGEASDDPTKNGMNGFTNGYQNYVMQRGNPSDFTLNRKLLESDPRFAVLLKQAPK